MPDVTKLASHPPWQLTSRTDAGDLHNSTQNLHSTQIIQLYSLKKKTALTKEIQCSFRSTGTVPLCQLHSWFMNLSVHTRTVNLNLPINYMVNLLCSLNRFIVSGLPYAAISPLFLEQGTYITAALSPTSNSLRLLLSSDGPVSPSGFTLFSEWWCDYAAKKQTRKWS